MKQQPILCVVVLLLAIFLGVGCSDPGEETDRQDNAVKIDVHATGSLQNPA